MECLRCLEHQTRRPDFTVVLGDNIGSPAEKNKIINAFPSLNLIFPEKADSMTRDYGFFFAFTQLRADFVWILDSAGKAHPDALAALLKKPYNANDIPVSLMTIPGRKEELSMPLLIENGKNIFAPWKSVTNQESIPRRENLSLRTGWWGALYPREVCNRIGAPKANPSLCNSNDEYAWKAKLAGFRFLLIPGSEIEHPLLSKHLIHYKIGGRSFFYECGLSPELRYYKIRNWAWIQRLRKPGHPLLRFLFCLFYIILAFNAMLKCNEFRPRPIYDLFRALHNGFYGKLRPYRTRKI